MQGVQPPGSGQFQVEQHHIDILRIEHAISLLRRVRNHGVESERLRHFAADFPDGAFVVHDQEIQEFRGFDLG
jgi:hypothetical protein